MKNSLIKNKSGFSLIEVLVASTISSMILLMVYTSYTTIIKTISGMSGYSEFYQNVNLTLARINKDISNIFYRTDKDYTPLVSTGTNENLTFSFLTVNKRDYNILGSIKSQNPATDISEVRYSLTKDPVISDLYILTRTENIDYIKNPMEGGAESVVINNVISLKFEFRTGNDWEDSWDSRETKRYPSEIRTTLRLRDYKGNPEEFKIISYIDING